MTIDDLFGRRIPLALVAALLLQAGTAVWWAAGVENSGRFQQQRIDRLEEATAQTKEGQGQVMVRLARIEERANAQLAVLDRIEKQLGAARE